MRKLIMGLAGALLASSMTLAHAEDKKVSIAVSIPAADHGWTGGVVYHAERAAKILEANHPGLKIIIKTSPDGASQANALEDLTTQGINALVTLPHNSDELTDPIRQVKSKGVFVTVVDRALSDPTIQDLYVAGNNPELGRVAGKYLKDKLGTADVVVIRGLPIVIDEERQKGFDEAIAGSGIKVLDKQFGNWSRDDAFKVMQDYLTKFPKIDAVWCQDDDMAVGVLEAISQAKRTDIKMVIGGAGMKDMIKRVGDGDAMTPINVLYPPSMIATALELTVANFYDQVPVRGKYILDATLVTKENAKEFYFPDSPF
ncbi:MULTISPECIES: substrate-binding domain-containing protein [unclassified Phyllobacterium]|uniref:substrate-binding domain-containing protein n=1 Tax=Phyllobacterium TaxID=28100 RepID=UPI000DDBE3C6|nr:MULTISPECIES: substrate-binding domain-containing protein [unclassified Phyllobacterium]MBA8901996.1 ribose transport system substrate-binding protein [Phyllobacterium sp. P30BS-XVII]UGX88798.1 substrate-binding domain-containing protein [Phyllobacterium sp. T1293]